MRAVRVLVTKEGCALPALLAEKRYGIKPAIVFYRDDGWSLGSPANLEAQAYRIWKDRWTHFTRDDRLQPISEYQPPKEKGTK